MRTKISSSASQLRAFMNGTLGRDMRRELRVWQKMAEEEFAIATDLLQLGKIQGRIEAIKAMMILPETMMDLLESMEDEEDES